MPGTPARSHPYALLAVLASAALLLTSCGGKGATDPGPDSVPTMHTDLSAPEDVNPDPILSSASPSIPSGSHTAPAQSGSSHRVELSFVVKPRGGLGNARVFYGAYIPVTGEIANPGEHIPELGTDSGYVSTRLTYDDASNVYTDEVTLDPGRYLVAIFTGIRATGKGYPTSAVEVIHPSSADYSSAVIRLQQDRTVSTVFRSATAGGSKKTRSCGEVAFQQASDHGAFDIRATGVPCDVARDVAAAIENIGEPYTHAGFTCPGFTCRTDGPTGELSVYPYRCTNDSGAVITFEAN